MKYIFGTMAGGMLAAALALLLTGCARGSDFVAPTGGTNKSPVATKSAVEVVEDNKDENIVEEIEPVAGEDMTMEEVKWLQESLKIAGFYTALDGEYGQGTAQQLAAFQEANGIETTGMLDGESRQLLEDIRQERLAPELGTISVLINKDYYLPSDYVPEGLRKVEARATKEVEMVDEAAGKAEEMLAAAEKDGVYIFIVSGYRSYDYQENLFRNRVAQYGFEEAEKVVAVPGESEHQTGLAMDISTEAMGYGLSQTFEADPAFEWMQEHCADYGFILRYRKGKEDVTGYIYEPWHYRYIGDVEMAKAIMDKEIVYEEY